MTKDQFNLVRKRFGWMTEDAFSILLSKLNKYYDIRKVGKLSYLKKAARSARIADMLQKGYKQVVTLQDNPGHSDIVIRNASGEHVVKAPKKIKNTKWEILEVYASVLGEDENGETFGYEDILPMYTETGINLNNHPRLYQPVITNDTHAEKSERLKDNIISIIDDELKHYMKLSLISPIFLVMSGDKRLKQIARKAGITTQNLNAKKNMMLDRIAIVANARLKYAGIEARVDRKSLNAYLKAKRHLK